MTWLPIEIAPKDEDIRILATDGYDIRVANWDESRNDWVSAVLDAGNSFNVVDKFYGKVTHWMTLPDLPGGGENPSRDYLIELYSRAASDEYSD